MLGVHSFFEEHQERGVSYLDGYVYASPGCAPEVLQALKDAEVEVDIADVPDNRELIEALEAIDWAREINVE